MLQSELAIRSRNEFEKRKLIDKEVNEIELRIFEIGKMCHGFERI